MKTTTEAIDFALKLAEDVPEEYRLIAFPELLRYSLSSLATVSSIAKDSELPRNHSISSDNISDTLPDLHILAKKGSRDQHIAWAIAELFSRNEEANNLSIRDVIREYLAISPLGRQNTNRSLRNLTPKYVLRTKTDNKYHYIPNAQLAEIFQNLNDES